MKLLRYAVGEKIGLGVLSGEGIVPLDALASSYPTMRSIIAGGAEALSAIGDLVAKTAPSITLSSVRLLCPVEDAGKYLAIGLNYAKHVEESERIGVSAPKHQLWFNKQTSCLSGPFDDIDPGVSEQVDYEVELGLVIGKPARRVSEADAPGHVFGYFVANDVSARDWQFHSPTFTIGKSFDSHGPIGPWIVTADEIPNPHALSLRCLVNGEVRQDSNSALMIFNIWKQIAYLSTAFTLHSGDLIATGTPDGVGIGFDPPKFLKVGDVVRCEVEGIGAIENTVRRG